MRRTAAQWSALSPAYRSRLGRAGISERDYMSGAPLSAARGHAQTPERPERAQRNPAKYPRYVERHAEQLGIAQRSQGEYEQRALALGVSTVIPNFALLPDEIRENVALLYVKGFMTPGPATDEGIIARVQLQAQLYRLDREYPDMAYKWEAEKWKAFRAEYARRFG